MKLFAQKDVRNFLIAVIMILLCFIIAGQVAAGIISENIKKEMISHDYAVAGYLYRNSLEKQQIATAFTAEKTNEDLTAGRALLQPTGYDSSVNSSLIPEVRSFHQEYAVRALLLTVTLSLAILAPLLLFVAGQSRKLEKANADLSQFLSGDHNIRLSDSEEGSLSKLFSTVNVMATSLTAHLTKEKQNQEFLKDTISEISHQLKTPLTALQMYNEIIRDENSGNDVVDRFLLKSRNELDRMENLISNLLKLARLDAGAVNLEKRIYNVNDFLKSVIDRFHTRAEIEDKTITLACDNQITLCFDKDWLLEAVSNIIKNGLDHTKPENKIELLCDETSVVTRIAIRDNGLGIHPEDIHYIFKRFYRSRFSKDKQGIGIGLTLSKSIIEKHGGSIVVESELGKGTTFYMTFPKLTNL